MASPGDCGSNGELRPKSLERWQRLTLLAQGNIPDFMLLEDANDLVDFLEATRRTVPRRLWADEVIAAARANQLEGLF
jgi:hypothetical protein